MHKEDALYQEAYEKLLDSWIVLLTDDTSFPMETLKQHALQIFNAYLGCHLAPPDGMRNQVSAMQLYLGCKSGRL